ncbi:LEM-3-like GIY-YIG domain-containing protein [Carnobacterium maltaromaticum]|uniref:LEM-3-like GIY-YIG domain-containing protein n=1 Tax=Carnobacterium maltaromaticum TaxID=2751 RepID=UPI001DAF574E|nr:hypothetical protein [Carnobacterium maltaromaticum]MCC4311294.1 hypothetical protein [Carnobacterium maltaromaticum]
MTFMNSFSDSTIAELEKNGTKKYYVYCLIDPRDNQVFYIGKGIKNRVFSHEKYALGKLEEELEGTYESDKQLKVEKIREISSFGEEVRRFIISYNLTENEAFASENTLINYLKIIENKVLTNSIDGHGTLGMSVEQLERNFGYQPISIRDIHTDGLILAVKINNSFELDTNETIDFTFYERDDYNLKARTLGNWRIGKDKIDRIKYIIGVNSGANNSVVSAYEIKLEEIETGLDQNGKKRYYFHSSSKSIDTLKQLGLYKKCLADLRFGSGSEKAYIDKESLE